MYRWFQSYYSLISNVTLVAPVAIPLSYFNPIIVLFLTPLGKFKPSSILNLSSSLLLDISILL